MKKELPVKTIVGILAVVIVVVGIIAWKTLIVPSLAPPPAHFTKEMSAQHQQSADLIREDQKRRAAAQRGNQ